MEVILNPTLPMEDNKCLIGATLFVFILLSLQLFNQTLISFKKKLVVLLLPMPNLEKVKKVKRIDT